jgi:uncharacterized protein YecE (DUF72 family)
MAKFLVGTSGWKYQGWRGVLYPPELPTSRWLSYYAGNFDTAEINYSFYHLPHETTYENWYVQTPPGFVFALKASRFITHTKRLNAVQDSWNTFVERAAKLREKLGPILLQFPPSFHATPENMEWIAEFPGYATGSATLRIALEFRHASCFETPMIDLLKRAQAALVIAHSVRYPVPEAIATARLA